MLRGYAGFVAFAVLAFVGWRILRSGSSPRVDAFETLTWPAAWGLGAATSADALAVGFGLAMTGADIVLAAGIIGIVTAGLSALGFLIGKPLGRGIGDRGKTIAALTLFAMGVGALAGHAG
jgi:putative Mn2+ efflux pump MntP